MLSKLASSLQQYQDKKILILGFGREGLSSYHFLRSLFPNQELFVMDKNPAVTTKIQDPGLIFCPNYLRDLSDYDLIFKTAGVSIAEPAIQTYLQQNGQVTSQLNEFLKVYAQQTIGITGTKGKSTTSSLLFEILKTAGKEVVYGGNIGVPVFELVKDLTEQTQVVLEASSYQLETVKYSPHVAVILNLFPEHLNYHQGMDNYLAAKAKITVYQKSEDFFFFNDHFPELKQLVQQTKAQAIAFTDPKYQAELSQFSAELAHLPLIIQQQNALPAMVIAQKLGTSTEVIKKAFARFQTLPHRLEKVATLKGISFYDDTLATIPQATIAAIDALSKVDVIILGGYDRGIEYQSIIDKVVAAQIPHLIFFPSSGDKMIELLGKRSNQNYQPTIDRVESMEAAVKLSYGYLPQGGQVLLSPASPSFGIFKDYEDKAAQYLVWINKLGS